MNPPISEYTKGLEDFLVKNRKPKSMAIVYENSMFGMDGMKRMMEFCRDNAVEVQHLISYDRTKASIEYFRPLLAPLTSETPDAIYMISYLNDAVALVKTIRQLGITTLLCGGAGGFTHEAFIKGAGPDANLVLTATLWFRNAPYPGPKSTTSSTKRNSPLLRTTTVSRHIVLSS
jgi:branched-chain amino acid transport system substrate-binding protein